MNNFLNGKYLGIAQVRGMYPEEYVKIIEFNKNLNCAHWGQVLYNYVNNLSELPTCGCGNYVNFIKFNRGYNLYCSKICRYNDADLKIKIKQSFINKFGVENPLQSPEIQEKRKKLYFEKHGVEHQSQLESVKAKRKETNLKNCGYTTNLLCEDTKNKITKTNLRNFGVEHNSQSEIIKAKKKQTNIKNCGFEYNFNSDDFREKSEITTLNKFGVKHTSLSSEIRKKQIISKQRNKINEIANELNIDYNDITFIDDILTINNYCEKHQMFDISINLLHQRRFKYDNKICTKCYPVQKQSSGGEIELKNYVDSLTDIQSNNRKILTKRFEIDIYLPDNKLGVEYDGIYWHSTLFKNKSYHLNKTEECEKQGIQLLHVFEDEWISKKEIVKSIIKSKLGLIEYKIFARKCIIKEIESKTSNAFLEANHIQGNGNISGGIRIGLFYKNELVSLMSFGKKRIAMGNKIQIEGEYEMLRFCNKLNTSVVGGASKLLSYFIKNHKPKSILTFADRRYSQGRLYKQLGFEFIGNTAPNYWYFKKNDLIRKHRFNFRKNVLVKEGFDANKTEHRIMNERGFLCIYDCGNMKFKLNLR